MNANRSDHRSRALVALAAAALVTATACSPGASTAAVGSSSSGSVATSVPPAAVTLHLAHFEAAGNGAAITALAKAYEKLHPNVTIDLSYTSFVDYGKSIKLTMSSDNAPDIAEVGQAYVMEGPLVKAGLLRPLDQYAKQYNWESRFKPGLLAESRFQSDGKSFGSGSLYGLALGGNMAGIYYNKQKLAKLGITVPFPDMAALDAALAKAKAAGEIPFQLGDIEQWEGNHLLSSLISQYETSNKVVDWIYGKPGATFATAGVTQATQELAQWSQKGYFDPAANGTSQDDAVAKFIAGKGVFFHSGNWALSQLSKGMGNNVGFTAVPPATAGASLRATGATTSPFAISAKSQHADVAANFIDFMTQPANAQILSDGGYAPVAPSNSLNTAKIGPLQAAFNSTYQKVLADDGLTLYLDWATTSMGNTLFPAVQELIGNKTTPDKLIAAVQADWQKAHAA